MRRSMILLLLVAGALPARAYQPAELWFTFQDTRITESSGVASSSVSDSVVFTHNDSLDVARLFAIGAAGQTLATVTVTGAPAANDWEDMARGPGAGGSALFIGDIGDNGRTRPYVTVSEIPEPVVDEGTSDAQVTVAVTSTTTLIYEDGPHDAETLLVHPQTGEIAIVTKEASGVSGIYVAAPPLLPGLPRLLRRVATIDFRAVREVPLPSALRATGGDIAPDGGRFIVRTYFEAFEWTLGPGGFAPAVATPPLVTRLAYTQQGEAIAYSRSGTALIDTSEGVGAPVHRYAA